MNDPRGSSNQPRPSTFEIFKNIPSMVKKLKPSVPVHCWHLSDVKPAVDSFVKNFSGSAFCAIKANPEPKLLQYLYDNGIRCFDVASLYEVKLARNMFPETRLAFMNPIKHREAIRSAYYEFGVKDFSLDTVDELNKILEETQNAKDLGLHVRLAVPKGQSAYDISGTKFGAPRDVAVDLLNRINHTGNRIGICFHIGSQMMDPQAYGVAIEFAGDVVKEANVQLSVFDVGGGFPAAYPGPTPPPLEDFFSVIDKAIAKINLPAGCEIWCEPGRALTAPSQSLVVQVTLRKGEYIYINDGVYGSLAEASDFTKQNYPAEVVRLGSKPSKKIMPFKFYGPTCDSIDRMAGPFYLPEDVKEGDWIILHMHGAYGTCSQSNFNGFYSEYHVEIGEKISNDNRAKNVIPLRNRRKVIGKPVKAPKASKKPKQ